MTFMSDRIHELLHRNLQEVFGEGNAARRRAAIAELCAEDCVLEAPPGAYSSAPVPSINLFRSVLSRPRPKLSRL
jgi:hypothetical protein